MAVPDDEHVTLRQEDGTEMTLALDDIREATLVVELRSSKAIEGRSATRAAEISRGSATDDDVEARPLARQE